MTWFEKQLALYRHDPEYQAEKQKLAESEATFISEVWAGESSRALEFMKALGILVSPAYPHRRRWGFRWWHRWCCYGCAQARVMWPLMRRSMAIKLGMIGVSIESN